MHIQHIYSRAGLSRLSAVLLLVVILLVLPVMADGLYRTANEKTYSKCLGVMTIPTLVIVDNARHPGIYVTTMPNFELGQSMKLGPGTVLLTLDGYSITSSKMADGWLEHRSNKPMTFTYAVAVDGKPKIFTGQVQSTASAPSAASPHYPPHDPRGIGGAPTHDSGSASAPTAGAPKWNAPAEAELATYCLSLINDSRKSNGLGPLQDDGTLARFASDYATYMSRNAKDYELSVARSPHVDLNGRSQLERAHEAGATNFLNENIGRASRGIKSDMSTLATLHSQFMSSPGHRESILDPEAHFVGIGIARLPARFYLTEEFGK